MTDNLLNKVRIGVVSSAKMDKTITVLIERKLKHPIYGKFVKNQRSSLRMTKRMNVKKAIQSK